MLVSDINYETIKTTTILEILCDYCGDKIHRKYNNHLLIDNNGSNDIVDKDACEKCVNKKILEIRDLKQQKGILTKSDHGYWQYKENILKELNVYIQITGTLRNMQKDNKNGGKLLWSAIKANGYHPFYLAKELGYKLIDLTNYRPLGYYDDFKNITEEVDELISRIGRFPTSIELTRIGINAKVIRHYGGITEFKKLLGFTDNLVDDSGFKNSSRYEFIVAQFLLKNGISYKREKHPFPDSEGKYRSDFTFYTKNKEIHVEVWGFPLTSTSNRGLEYNKVRKIKTQLYKKYGITLIGIECEIFNGTYENIIHDLTNTFKMFLSNDEIETVELEKTIQANKMTDIEILDFLNSLIPNKEKDLLPTGTFVRDNYRKIYTEIRKRHVTYLKFIEKFGCKTNKKSNLKWSKPEVFEMFQECLNKYNKILNYSEMNSIKKHDKNLIGLEGGINKNGGFVNLRLEFYKESGFDIYQYPSELNWVQNVSLNKTIGIHTLSNCQIQSAKDLLKINNYI